MTGIDTWNMGIPGYDLADLDDHLEERLAGEDLSRWLTDEELVRYERGDAGLVDLLSGEDIEQILDLNDVEPAS